MISRATAIRALLFLVLTIALVFYIGAQFLGLFNFLGPKDYTVRLPLADATGLFERGEVTYRGVKVGSVGPLRLTDDGVEADLIISGDAPKIPSDVDAVVADRSAVGEKYVDLRPARDTGPYLSDGDEIAPNRVTTPVPVEDVLHNLDRLVATVPLQDLRTTVSELGTAFRGLGPKLQLLLDSTHSLTVTATEHLPQTLALVRDARSVLQTQNDLANPIKSFSKDLRLVSEQLKESDPDIRRLLDTGPDAAHQIDALLDESGPGLSKTIKELLTLSQITKAHNRDLQTVLQTYPILAALIPSVVPGDGSAHLGLVLNIEDPPNCTKGYEDTVRRPGSNVSEDWPINYRAYCRTPLYSPTDVRGVKPQYPFVNGKPRSAPDWFHAFYTDGPAAGINGAYRGGHRDDKSKATSRSGGASGPALPGLLDAPAAFGEFGLTPSVLRGG